MWIRNWSWRGWHREHLFLRTRQTIHPCKPSNVLLRFKKIIVCSEKSMRVPGSLWSCSFPSDLWNGYERVFSTFALISSLTYFHTTRNYLTLLGWGGGCLRKKGLIENADKRCCKMKKTGALWNTSERWRFAAVLCRVFYVSLTKDVIKYKI